jgi:TRAP-type C4-dicarboxylate transport system permease large subunit
VHSKYLFLLLLNIFLILVGCLMDIYSAILIVSPLIIPIAESFGLSQVHIGVVFLMNMQLGFLTPPVGMDLFISTYAFDKPLMKVVKGVLPYLAIQAVVLLLVTYIPWFTTIIP